jgi:hypothetical protein
MTNVEGTYKGRVLTPLATFDDGLYAATVIGKNPDW